MNSSFLCVMIMGYVFQVFAQDRFHSKLWRRNLQKINEENQKSKADELADYITSNAFEDDDQPPLMSAEKTKGYLVCAEKTGVSPDTILSIKKGDWTDDDRNAKEWVQCVLIENSLMTDQSVFRLDVAFNFFSDWERQSLEENIDKCLPNKAMPPVEISWEFAKCFQTTNPENSLF